ncbi:MAG: hypothetical protein KJ718_05455 [Nanoarchaeota archaeon]|nr:hypothetical protein [Nanoarchaeota archaeon]MBU1051969.1 hypothetical protein [Nanoarchaeota archaeon]MBU1988652.1 hypothetical protein [Nanoarchaeota archaeon]
MRKIWAIVILAAIVVLVLMVALKTLSNEDDWICVDGKWERHGWPSAEKPAEPCGENFVQRIFGG